MKCEKCGHTRHEGSAVIAGVGAMLTFMALDHLIFKGAVGQKAIWLYPILFVVGCVFGWWRDKEANKEVKEEEKVVKFENEEPNEPP
jgi:hypothetical protein